MVADARGPARQGRHGAGLGGIVSNWLITYLLTKQIHELSNLLSNELINQLFSQVHPVAPCQEPAADGPPTFPGRTQTARRGEGGVCMFVALCMVQLFVLCLCVFRWRVCMYDVV